MEQINWISIVIAALVPLAMGFIWYHKAVFGKAWMAETGITEEKAKEANMVVTFGISLVLAALLAFFLVGFNNGPGQEGEFDTFKNGAAHGVVIGLFVAMPIMITNGLFEQRSWKHMFINLGYWVVTLAIMGGIIDVMNHLPNTLEAVEAATEAVGAINN